MSKTKQVLELHSPDYNSRTERVEGLAQKCHYCCGNGWFWGVDELGESEKQPCKMCNGKGLLKPFITVEWKAVTE